MKPIFKKYQKTIPDNYRRITLLNSILKAFTRTWLEEINKTIQIREELQGFRKKGLPLMRFSLWSK